MAAVTPAVVRWSGAHGTGLGVALLDGQREVTAGRGLLDAPPEVTAGRGLLDAPPEVTAGRGLLDPAARPRVIARHAGPAPAIRHWIG